MNNEDHAIVVGIDLYPGISPLSGAQNDAKAFAAWLVAPDGGVLPPGNIHFVLTSHYHPPDPPLPCLAGPNVSQFGAQLQALLADTTGQPRPFPVGRRVYLYFSGHGFMGFSTWDEAALYAANATLVAPEHIAGTRVANALKAAGAFDEVVLVMDCCRDVTLTERIVDPLLKLSPNPTRAAKVRTFYSYAVPCGGKSRERQLTPGGPVQGVFTHVLLEALQHAPGNQHGYVRGENIKNYIHNRWPALSNETGPQIQVDTANDLVFAMRPPPGLVRTTVRIAVDSPLPAGAEVVILDGQLQEALRLPVGNGSVSCLLIPGFYKMRLEGTGREKLFQVMGETTSERI
jgi:hypothetical protein